jgi:hypothetical protein
MTEISYRVVPRGKSGFDVEMDKPDGRRRTVPGFHSEHEAEAWIVQAKRMIRDAGPWTPLAPRKPAAAEVAKPLAAGNAPSDPGQALPHDGQRAATPSSRVRAVSERSEA